MKKIFFLIICFALTISLFSCNTVDPETMEFKYTLQSEEKGCVEYQYLSQEEFDALTEEQQEDLKSIWKGSFVRRWWQEKVILGETDESSRLDLDAARKILSKYDENTDIRVILYEFSKLQEYPDQAGGSGILSVLFWVKGEIGDRTNATVIVVFCEFGTVNIGEFDQNGDTHLIEEYQFASPGQ